jgi:DNA-binding response OmpR family regulator
MENKKFKVLIVEDDPNLGAILSEYLGIKGYETTLKNNGEDGYIAFKKHSWDCIILDVMMPKKDGFTLAKDIRRENPQVPIIFLTAKSLKEDTIEGFKLGADDYITKPFSMEELLLRIKAVLRRVEFQGGLQEEIYEFQIGKILFNYREQTLSLPNGDVEKLTSKENDLLRILAINLNNVIDRSDALLKIWGDDSYFNSRSMDVYITKLRKLLKEDENLEILNVHGKGFKLILKD